MLVNLRPALYSSFGGIFGGCAGPEKRKEREEHEETISGATLAGGVIISSKQGGKNEKAR